MANVLFEDIFELKDIDKEGKKFERVSRLHCDSEFFKTSLILDIHSQIYPIELGDKFRLLVASSDCEEGYYTTDDWDPHCGESSFQERFEYVMFGKIYRIEETNPVVEEKQFVAQLAVYISFGGLLMRLEGSDKSLQGFGIDEHVFLLINKIPA